MRERSASIEKVRYCQPVNVQYSVQLCFYEIITKSLEELDDEFEIIDDQADISVDPVKVHRSYYVYMCRILPDPDLYAKHSPTKGLFNALSTVVKFSLNVESQKLFLVPSKPVIDYDQQMIQFSSLPDEDDAQEVITMQPGSKTVGNSFVGVLSDI